MAKETYNKLIESNKEYLIEFIRSIESLPQMNQLGGKDLSEEEIKKFESFYDRWFNN